MSKQPALVATRGKWLLVMVALAALVGTTHNQQTTADEYIDLSKSVLQVFSAKCAGCHSVKAKEVQGNFNYVLNLKKLSADVSKIVPRNPEDSNLWKLVGAGNMPPNNSGIKLTDAEKKIVRDWIVAGAPVGTPSPGLDGVPSLPPPETARLERESFTDHLLRWTGELHLLLLHFPIVCILAACLAEVIGIWPRSPDMVRVTYYCLIVGAIFAIPTVVCGWVYASIGHGSGQPSNLLWHRWLGIVGGWLLVATALFAIDPLMRKWQYHTIMRRTLLGLTAAVIVAAAHLGGVMAFGERFLSW